MKASAMTDQYSEQQVAFWIDGYYSVMPAEPRRKTPELAFQFAKDELVERFLLHIRSIEEMTWERWQVMKEAGI